MTRKSRVLLVDDKADFRLLVRQVLDASDAFEVVGEAGDGAEGLELAARTHPDLVLLDLAMPTMGGLEALPRLREAAPEARIIVLSVYQGERFRDATRSAGAVGYLEKGIPARRFVEALVDLAGLVDAVEVVVQEATRHLQGHPRDVGEARRFVSDLLERHGCTATIDLVRILVSEVVTNAILHAGTDVEVSVRLGPEHVRVDVRDHSAALPQQQRAPAGALETGGRGLLLLERVASAWGVIPADGGKVVWFEVPRSPSTGDEAVVS